VVGVAVAHSLAAADERPFLTTPRRPCRLRYNLAMAMKIEVGGPLEIRTDRPRMRGRNAVVTAELVIGEWSLTAAAWTDRHLHEETNWVLEGELHVTCDGRTEVVGVGGAVVVPAGTRARYEAPVHARMLFVYGPSTDGHATIEGTYEELPAAPTATGSPARGG
jgi:mannose-6-phosphate isomerase-like protein (cupin superfamily)